MPAFLDDISGFVGDGSVNEDGLSLAEYLKTYNPSIYRSPSLTADVMILRHSGEFTSVYEGLSLLMVKRRNHPCIGYWALPGGFAEIYEDIDQTAKRELQEETGAVKFEIKPICVYSVTGKTRVNNTGEETFGLLCFAEITEFAKELHSEMEKVVLMDKLPENWTYPLIQPKLIEKYLQMKNFVDDTL